jgi:hypothetical protein
MLNYGGCALCWPRLKVLKGSRSRASVRLPWSRHRFVRPLRKSKVGGKQILCRALQELDAHRAIGPMIPRSVVIASPRDAVVEIGRENRDLRSPSSNYSCTRY